MYFLIINLFFSYQSLRIGTFTSNSIRNSTTSNWESRETVAKYNNVISWYTQSGYYCSTSRWSKFQLFAKMFSVTIHKDTDYFRRFQINRFFLPTMQQRVIWRYVSSLGEHLFTAISCTGIISSEKIKRLELSQAGFSMISIHSEF